MVICRLKYIFPIVDVCPRVPETIATAEDPIDAVGRKWSPSQVG